MLFETVLQDLRLRYADATQQWLLVMLRQPLSSSQHEAFEAIPLDCAELIKHSVLSGRELSLILGSEEAQNRLGLAVQPALLRFPGRALLPDETPPAELLAFLVDSLKSPSPHGAAMPNTTKRAGNI